LPTCAQGVGWLALNREVDYDKLSAASGLDFQDASEREKCRAGLSSLLLLAVGATQSAEAQTFTRLYSFAGPPDGQNPYGGVARDNAGNLYGTTLFGGVYDWGTVFKLSKTGKETVLYSFAGGTDGENPIAGVVGDKAGNLYGTTEGGGCSSDCGTVFKVSNAGKETVLHSFAGGTTDGCEPEGFLLRDQAGNLYGTTYMGGSSKSGTVFKLDTTGKETVLHNFAGYPSDGAYPLFNGLRMDTKGNLYGTTYEGGASGEGTVFKLSKNGTETVLYNFAGGTADGCQPLGSPAMDKNGNLYGTTEQCGYSHHGIVWKVSQTGTETVLHDFAGGSSDGAYPLSSVTLDAKGNLYGDTFGGGAYSSCTDYDGCGTVYELNQNGVLTLLHSFDGADGANPKAGLRLDANGDLYGTATIGGDLNECNDHGCGTVWKLTP